MSHYEDYCKTECTHCAGGSFRAWDAWRKIYTHRVKAEHGWELCTALDHYAWAEQQFERAERAEARVIALQKQVHDLSCQGFLDNSISDRSAEGTSHKDLRYLSMELRGRFKRLHKLKIYDNSGLSEALLLDHADYMDEVDQNNQDYINTIRLNMPQEYCQQPQLDLCMQRMKEALAVEKQRAEQQAKLMKELESQVKGVGHDWIKLMEERDQAQQRVTVLEERCAGYQRVAGDYATTIGQQALLAKELADALSPFSSVAALNEVFLTRGTLSPETPLRDVIPGAWPTMADCIRARAALARFDAAKAPGAGSTA